MATFVKHRLFALFFILPQLLVTLVFFIWPAVDALIQSLYFTDPFGLHRQFAALANFIDLFHDPDYLQALWVTLLMVFFISFLTLSSGLVIAYLVSKRKKSQGIYKSLMIWPYAVAPAVAAILWRFLCHPNLGWIAMAAQGFGFEFNYLSSAWQAMAVVILSASWQQFSYNFLFYYAAIRAIPRAIDEAAMLDGASAWKRFWQIYLPLLSPTTFFLLVMNLIYAFFETFGIIQIMTHGGPGQTTTNLIYRVYEDGFIGMDIGSAAAQSVILMIFVIALTLLQFRYLEKRVHFQ